ncbi:EboA domain-containing protein [Monashia sp. NPDC004114]
MSDIDAAIAEVATRPEAIERHFPAAARRAAREGRDGDDTRMAMLLALNGPRDEVLGLAERLYWQGDTSERLAVLRALHPLDGADRPNAIGDGALPLVRDALRTNDSRLIAAAMGQYAARHLDTAAWRQAVLKFLFVGIPIDQVAGLDTRADAELGRMVADYVAERQAAGRTVPSDALAILDLVEHTSSVMPARAE